MERAEKPSAHIEITPARPEQEPVLADLLELYAHDFSEFHDLELGSGSCEEIVFCRKGVRMRFRRWLLGRGEIEGLGFKWVLVRN